MRDFRADRLARAGAEAAERARVHPAARLVGVDVAARVGDEVTAVADDDRVAVEHLVEFAVDPHRVERRARVVELLALLFARLGLDVGQLLDPRLRPRPLPRRGGERRQPGGDVADQVEVRQAVRGQRVRRDVEADHLRLGAEAAAEAEPEVERHADDERDVGALQRGRAGAAEGEVVVGGQAAAAEAVEEDRDAERLGQRPQLVLAARPVEPGAGHDHRPLGPGQQRRGLLDSRRAAARRARSAAAGTSNSASLKTTSIG